MQFPGRKHRVAARRPHCRVAALERASTSSRTKQLCPEALAENGDWPLLEEAVEGGGRGLLFERQKIDATAPVAGNDAPLAGERTAKRRPVAMKCRDEQACR